MKKFVLAASIVAFTAGLTLAAPASAQGVCQHDIYHQYSCPPGTDGLGGGYRGNFNTGYGYDYYYRGPTIFDALFLSLFQSHKPVACYDANGKLYLVRRKELVPATGSEVVQIKKLGAVTTTCGDSTYTAVAQPEAASEAPAASGNSAPVTWTIVKDGRGYQCHKENGTDMCLELPK